MEISLPLYLKSGRLNKIQPDVVCFQTALSMDDGRSAQWDKEGAGGMIQVYWLHKQKPH